jgi:hypothetical protein
MFQTNSKNRRRNVMLNVAVTIAFLDTSFVLTSQLFEDCVLSQFQVVRRQENISIDGAQLSRLSLKTEIESILLSVVF